MNPDAIKTALISLNSFYISKIEDSKTIWHKYCSKVQMS